ncbi:MAG: Abi family protein, partial [Chitinophagaceae bacterium]|nr:Abi family protein [Chitinophagaceae bacterium]
VNEHQMLYVHLCCMKYLLDVASPGNNFTTRLLTLLHNYPSVDIRALGIPADWEKELLWLTNGE